MLAVVAGLYQDNLKNYKALTHLKIQKNRYIRNHFAYLCVYKVGPYRNKLPL